MSDSVQPHRRQPTRLPRPWDSPSKNTGVGCHFLLQCMKVKSECEVSQSCLTPSDPMDCSLPGSSVHEIFQARVLEWVAIAFSTLVVETYANRTSVQLTWTLQTLRTRSYDYECGISRLCIDLGSLSLRESKLPGAPFSGDTGRVQSQ